MSERRISGAVFRADHPDHANLSETEEASRKEPGRFNTSRFGALFIVWIAVANVVDLSEDERLGVIHALALSPTVVSAVDAGVPVATLHPLLSTFPRATASA